MQLKRSGEGTEGGAMRLILRREAQSLSQYEV